MPLLMISKDDSEWMEVSFLNPMQKTDSLDSHLYPPQSKIEDIPIQLGYVKSK